MTSGFDSFLETIKNAAKPENNGSVLRNFPKTSQEEFSNFLDAAQKSYDSNNKYTDTFSEKDLAVNKNPNSESTRSFEIDNSREYVKKIDEQSEKVANAKSEEKEPVSSSQPEQEFKAEQNGKDELSKNELVEGQVKNSDKKDEIKARKTEKENEKDIKKAEKLNKTQEETEKELLNDRIKLAATSINLNLNKDIQQKPKAESQVQTESVKSEVVKKENNAAKNISQPKNNVVDITVKNKLQSDLLGTSEEIETKTRKALKQEAKKSDGVLEKTEAELTLAKKPEKLETQKKLEKSEKLEKLENAKADNKAVVQEQVEQKLKTLQRKKEVQGKELAEKKGEVLIRESQLENINPKIQENNAINPKKSEKLENIRPEIEKIEVKTTAKNPSANTGKEHGLSDNLKDKVQMNLNGAEDLSVKINPDKDIQFSKVLESKETVRPQLNDSVMDQIKKATVEFGQNKSELEMTLRPKDLGKVEIKLISENGTLTAQIKAENSQVKDILGKEIETLKQNLTEQGINVGKITVQESNPSSNSNHNSQFDQDLHRFDQKSDNAENQNSFRRNMGYNTLSENNEYFGEENIELAEGSQVESQASRGLVDYRV